MHVTRWGPEPTVMSPPVFLLHGWLDVGDTFQFMVDAFKKDRSIVAPDLRGFGRSEWPQEGYGFPDYLADLEALLDQISPHAPVSIVGHSMGGNIANLYAGVRPDRVRCVVNLEGFGLPRTTSQDAPKRMRKWLDQIKTPAVERNYNSYAQLAAIIQHRYPRFSAATAAFVARVWGTADEGDRVRLAADPRHHWVNPIIYKREDSEAIWREIRAPLLMISGDKSDYLARLGADGTIEALRAAHPDMELASVPDAGHMLHIERPELVAPLVEAFLDAHH
jgi:pimeloyl-ACP methyl ester carboxylesterase